jgi:hypothetical protein
LFRRYSLFIFAFALGFYILLHRDDGHEEKADEYRFFDFLGLCIVKTFTMFVGELEFSDLPIETPVGYLFFLAFIFLIVVSNYTRKHLHLRVFPLSLIISMKHV